MNCFSKIAGKLTQAIEHQKTARVSFWHRQTVEELFDQTDPQNRFLINPVKAASFFSEEALKQLTYKGRGFAELAPREVEKALCAQYTDYINKSFWPKLWMRLTQPVSIDVYCKAYTLVTLRNLEKTYAGIAEKEKEMSGESCLHRDWGAVFAQTVAGLNQYLASELPKNVSMFQWLFKRKNMHCHVEDLAEFSKQAFEEMRTKIEKSYVAFMHKIFSCKTVEEQHECSREIEGWHEQHKNSIEQTPKEIDAESRKKYDSLLQSLQMKKDMLSGVLKIKNESELKPDIREEIDRECEHFSAILNNLQHACTVQFDTRQGEHENTYVVQRNFLNQWQLVLYAKPRDRFGVSYDVCDVSGLKNELAKDAPSHAEVEKHIVSFHHGGLRPEEIGSPLLFHRRVEKNSPDTFADKLLLACSSKLEAVLASGKQGKSTKWRDCAGQLQACYDYLQKKMGDFRERHVALLKRDELYTRLSKDISSKTKKAKAACMDVIVFSSSSARQHLTPEEIIETLKQECTTLSQENTLPRVMQRYLAHLAGLHVAKANELIPVLREIKSEGMKKRLFDCMHDLIDQSWEKGLENYFSRKWEKTEEREKQDWNYWGIRSALSTMTRDCLAYHVTESAQLLPELRNIYVKTERLRKRYLDDFEAKTRRLAIIPYELIPEAGEKCYHAMMVGALSKWDTMHGLIPRLLAEFREVLKEPGKHTHCLWMVATAPPDERMLESVPAFFNFAYVLVKTNHWRDKNTLYFLDKEKGLIEKIDLSRWKGRQEVLEEFLCTQGSPRVLTEEETFFITDLTGHSHDRRLYLYCILLKLLAYRVSGIMWGVWERNIDCEPEEWITSRMACTMAQEEMDRLCKRISLPYHPDRPYGSERTQIFLVQKRDEAKQRIDHFLNVQQELAQQHDLDIQRTQCVPVELARFIPRWIAPRGIYSHPGEEKKLIVNFCKVVITDMIIEERQQKWQESKWSQEKQGCEKNHYNKPPFLFTVGQPGHQAVNRDEESEEDNSYDRKKKVDI